MPETIEDLGRRVKAKYPGQYDDLGNGELGSRVKSKYPKDYGDFADIPRVPGMSQLGGYPPGMPAAPKADVREIPSFLERFGQTVNPVNWVRGIGDIPHVTDPMALLAGTTSQPAQTPVTPETTGKDIVQMVPVVNDLAQGNLQGAAGQVLGLGALAGAAKVAPKLAPAVRTAVKTVGKTPAGLAGSSIGAIIGYHFGGNEGAILGATLGERLVSQVGKPPVVGPTMEQATAPVPASAEAAPATTPVETPAPPVEAPTTPVEAEPAPAQAPVAAAAPAEPPYVPPTLRQRLEGLSPNAQRQILERIGTPAARALLAELPETGPPPAPTVAPAAPAAAPQPPATLADLATPPAAAPQPSLADLVQAAQGIAARRQAAAPVAVPEPAAAAPVAARTLADLAQPQAAAQATGTIADLSRQLQESIGAPAEAPPPVDFEAVNRNEKAQAFARHLHDAGATANAVQDAIPLDNFWTQATQSVNQSGSKKWGAPSPATRPLIVDEMRKLEQAPAATSAAREVGPHGPISFEFAGNPHGALKWVRDSQTGFAQGAIPHSIGDIGLPFGKPGDGPPKWKGGYGVSHIDVKHKGWLDANIGEISKWPVVQEFPNQEGGTQAVLLGDGKGNFAMVSRDWMGRAHPEWLLTGYERPAPAASVGVRGTPSGAAPSPAATGPGSSIAGSPAEGNPSAVPAGKTARPAADRALDARIMARKGYSADYAAKLSPDAWRALGMDVKGPADAAAIIREMRKSEAGSK